VKFGIYTPISGDYNVRALRELAVDAESSGWDGFFIWDNLIASFDGSENWDTTVALGAIALATDRITFGPLVTAVPRRRPWKLAKEMVTLDALSGGRVVLGAGLGGLWDFLPFGEVESMADRALMCDEALTLLERFWTGQSFSHEGRYYQLRDAIMLPRPYQGRHIPIWVAGHWPLTRPFERAARWQGAVPIRKDATFEGLTPDEIASCNSYIKDRRDSLDDFDLIYFHTAEHRGVFTPQNYAGTGATWWLESTMAGTESFQAFRRRVLAGPPR